MTSRRIRYCKTTDITYWHWIYSVIICISLRNVLQFELTHTYDPRSSAPRQGHARAKADNRGGHNRSSSLDKNTRRFSKSQAEANTPPRRKNNEEKAKTTTRPNKIEKVIRDPPSLFPSDSRHWCCIICTINPCSTQCLRCYEIDSFVCPI